MSAFDGKYVGGQLVPAKQLKGREGELPLVWLPTESDKNAQVQLPEKGTRCVFFLWSEALVNPRAIKILPESAEAVQQIEGVLAEQAAVRPGGGVQTEQLWKQRQSFPCSRTLKAHHCTRLCG